jgi:two-component system OmpR family sensor kinase
VTLRARLLAALVVLLVALGASGVVVTLVQRDYLYDQLDQQLNEVAARPRAALQRLLAGAGVTPTNGYADMYVGVIVDGTLTTVQAPTDDPELVPSVPLDRLPTTPTTRPTLAGDASTVRVLALELPRGRVAVFALSTARADAAAERLMVTLALVALVVLTVGALVTWWVIRLGLRPIRQMTAAADAISAGAKDTRIDVAPGATEAARLGQALNTMIDTAREAEAKLRRFVADASHELRTPLTTLRGYSALHSGEPATDPAALAEVSDAMRRINQEAARMTHIVDDLLDLTAMDEHRLGELSTFDLREVLDDLAGDLRVVQPMRPIEVDCPKSLIVSADHHRIVQAVAALAGNALRHTPTATPVWLTGARRPDGAVRVAVVDHGPGIAGEHLPHLFERFYRADRGRTRASGGNGLGLAIVAGIVTAHGGRYGAESPPGGPTSFWFELPPHPVGSAR